LQDGGGLVIANEEQYFASLVARDVEGVVGDFHEVGIGDTLEEHGAPLIVCIQVSEGSKCKPVSGADLIDAQHWAAEAIGMYGASAAVTGKCENDGVLHLHEFSIDSPGLGVVIVRKFPSAVQGKGLFIAGGPQHNGESDQELFHTARRLQPIKIPLIGKTTKTENPGLWRPGFSGVVCFSELGS